ncbi:MAG: hypothetical protein GY940_29585 [bacterium]|nr:hypothetical protein [bacterium]
MQKFKLRLPVSFLALLIFITGCSSNNSETIQSQTNFKHNSGIQFDFPYGWTPLSKKEWRDMKLGADKTLITIMDNNREAGFSLIPVGLNRSDSITLNLLGNEPAAKAVMFLEAMHAAGPGKYREYELFSKGATSFAGYPMAEIIYQGRNPGKSLKWYRVLALTGTKPANAILMFVFTTPIDEEEDFKEDFDFIEKSWKWKN